MTLDVRGHANATTPALVEGRHVVVASYLGDGYYHSGGTTLVFNVTAPILPIIYSYGIDSYGPNSNIASFHDSVTGTWTNIGYDAMNRLTGATQAINGSSLSMCWGYDSFGNQTSDACNPATPVQYLSNNHDPRLQYDSDGNVSDGDGNEYLYDAEGRICAAQYMVNSIPARVGYIYDTDGRRVAKGTISSWNCDLTSNGFSETNGYVVGPNGEQEAESDAQGNWAHTNVFANGELIATYDPAGLHFHFSDWIGSRRVQTDFLGNAESAFQNSPFGQLIPQGQSLGATEQQFAGLQSDQETGLDHAVFRYHSPSLGHWTSPDPYIGSANIRYPQTFNRYTYANNSPLSASDPSGLDPITAILSYFGSTGGGSISWSGSLGAQLAASSWAGPVGWAAAGVASTLELIFGGLWDKPQFTGSLTPRPSVPQTAVHSSADPDVERIRQLAVGINNQAGWIGTPAGVGAFYGASLAGAVGGLYAASFVPEAATLSVGPQDLILGDHVMEAGDAYHLGARMMADQVLKSGRLVKIGGTAGFINAYHLYELPGAINGVNGCLPLGGIGYQMVHFT